MKKVIEYLKLQQTLILIEIKNLNPGISELDAERCRNLKELKKEIPQAIRVLEKNENT